MWRRIGFALLCVVVPVVWGVLVNKAFDAWRARRGRGARGDGPIFPDYQI